MEENNHCPRFVICEVLRDLVPFVQFQKHEKHPWGSVTFAVLACSFTKSNTPHE